MIAGSHVEEIIEELNIKGVNIWTTDVHLYWTKRTKYIPDYGSRHV